MQRFKRIWPIALLVLWDIATVAVSVITAIKLSFWKYVTIPEYYQNHRLSLIVGISAVVIFFNIVCGCYNRLWRNIGFNEMIRQFLSMLFTMGVLFLADNWARYTYEGLYSSDKGLLPLTAYFIMAMMILLLSIIGRASQHFFLTVKNWISRRGSVHTDQPVIIYGAGEAGTHLAKRIANHPEMNLRVVAFMDDDESLRHLRINGIPIVGGKDDLAKAIQKYSASQVIVAIPTAERSLLNDIINICKQQHCAMRRFGTIDSANDLSKVNVSDIKLEDLLRRESINLNMRVVKEFVEGKVVLVTGGAGSIGSEICRQVLRFGCKKLIIFDIHENGLFDIDNELKQVWNHNEYAVRLGSIRDRERMNELFKEFSPQIVFHAAAHKHVPMMELNPCEAIKNNVFGTVNTAQVAIQNGVEKFILISTDKAVNPTNIMGASKRITELVIQMMDTVSDTDFAAVRFGNVLGSSGSVVPFFRKQIEKGGPVTVTHPDMRRYFMTIPEAVQLVLEAGAMANGGEIFVLDMGRPVLIRTLAEDLIRLSGYEPYVDIKIVYTGLRPGEKLFEEISMADEDVDRTANKKIVIMKPVSFDAHERAQTIKRLESTVTGTEDRAAMFDIVRELVPTFSHEREEQNQPE